MSVGRETGPDGSSDVSDNKSDGSHVFRDSEISAIEVHVSNLETLICALRSESDLLQQRLNSYRYPVLTLPNELTSEIFIRSLPAYPWCPPLTGKGSPSILTLICRKRRDIALSTPSLWRAVSLEGSKINLVKAWLARSGCYPLSLRCEDGSCDDEIMDAIIPLRARWEHVSVNFWQSRTPRTVIGGPIPLLRELEICISSSSGEVMDYLPALTDVPQLTAVTLWDFVYPEDLLPWSQLTSLILIEQPPSRCTQILQQTPNLEHCELLLESSDEDPQPDIHLPHLKRLIFASFSTLADDNEYDTEYLLSFVVPALRSLQIPEESLAPDPIGKLKIFLPKSQCQLHELHITGKRTFSTRTLPLHFGDHVQYLAIGLVNIGRLTVSASEFHGVPVGVEELIYQVYSDLWFHSCQFPMFDLGDYQKNWSRINLRSISLARLSKRLYRSGLNQVHLSAVSVQWNAIVAKDPALSVQMFKKHSKVYVEPGCVETKKSSWGANIADIIEENLHSDPKYMLFKLTMPQEDPHRIKSAWLQAKENVVAATALLADPKWKPRPAPAKIRRLVQIRRRTRQRAVLLQGDITFKLVDLAIANDFMSIPAVTTATLDVGPNGFTVKVKNSKGITLIDFFRAIDKEANVKVKRGRHTVTKGEFLGAHSFYEGLSNLMRIGSGLSAAIHKEGICGGVGMFINRNRREYKMENAAHVILQSGKSAAR
ncbi:hypothetical protein DFH06DRAFT_1132391 [Mycena polygramma]|nr:hypothetical protein DFH06DRAFT_1132391 [Mycena polygramma]